jgi:hypothetical protein
LNEAVKILFISTLNEIKDLPQAVSDPNWLKKIEADDGK